MYKGKYSLLLLPTVELYFWALTITIRVKQESSAIIANANGARVLESSASGVLIFGKTLYIISILLIKSTSK